MLASKRGLDGTSLLHTFPLMSKQMPACGARSRCHVDGRAGPLSYGDGGGSSSVPAV